MFTLGGNKESHALASYTKEKRIPFILFNLTYADKAADVFWDTVTNGLGTWSADFANRWSCEGFPASLEAAAQFRREITDHLKRDPLLLIFNHVDRLEYGPADLFLNTLVQMQVEESCVILLYGASSIDDHSHIAAGQHLTLEEEGSYYRENGLNLLPAHIQLLHSITEGQSLIVAALTQRLAISDLESILQSIDLFILQWMEQEYFEQFPKSVRHNLILLSYLDEFSFEMIHQGSIYEASDLLLMMKNTPFIQRNPHTLNYSFSPYYQRNLESHRALVRDDEVHEFFMRVGNWYLRHGDYIQAIKHYSRVKAYDNIRDIMSEWRARPDESMAIYYLEVIQHMPESYIAQNPYLVVVQCYMMVVLHKYKEALYHLERFIALEEKGSNLSPQMQTALGDAYLTYALVKYQTVDTDSVEHFQKAHTLLSNGSPIMEMLQYFFTEMYALRLRSPESGAFERLLLQLIKIDPLLSEISGKSYSCLIDLVKAELHFLRWEGGLVEKHALSAVQKAFANEWYGIACSALFLLMRLHLSKGRYREMMGCFEKLKTYAEQARNMNLSPILVLVEDWLRIKFDNFNDVVDWIKDEYLNRREECPHIGHSRIIRGCYLLGTKKYEEALTFLESAIPEMKERYDYLPFVQLLLIKSLVLSYLDRTEESVLVFEQVYDWIKNNKILGFLPEYGTYLRRIIKNCRDSKDCAIPTEWIDNLEQKTETYIKYRYQVLHEHRNTIQQSPASILRSLNEQENRLLQMLISGDTQAAMAEQLGISISGVKKKLQNVYKKIGATNRANAIHIVSKYGFDELD